MLGLSLFLERLRHCGTFPPGHPLPQRLRRCGTFPPRRGDYGDCSERPLYQGLCSLTSSPGGAGGGGFRWRREAEGAAFLFGVARVRRRIKVVRGELVGSQEAVFASADALQFSWPLSSLMRPACLAAKTPMPITNRMMSSFFTGAFLVVHLESYAARDPLCDHPVGNRRRCPSALASTAGRSQ